MRSRRVRSRRHRVRHTTGYGEFPRPVPQNSDEILVDVVASGLHPRVRSQAAGSHYTSSDELPLVPGIDGVGRAAEGALRYFVLPDTTAGAMAEQTVIDQRRSIALPEGTDPILVAAAVNPVMSSWVALRQRIQFEPGQSVLVLGATGSSVQLDNASAVADLARDVDVVIDYLWGPSTADLIKSIAARRSDPGKPLTWIEIGSVAGPSADIGSAALRAVRLQIVGSGQGSVPTRGFLSEMPDLIREISSGTFGIDARAVPLTEVATAWKDTSTDQRVVLTP